MTKYMPATSGLFNDKGAGKRSFRQNEWFSRLFVL